MKARVKEKELNSMGIVVATKAQLADIKNYPNLRSGQTIIVEEDMSIYTYVDNEFVPIVNENKLQIGDKDYTLYDVNKQIIEQLPNATEEDIIFSKDLIQTFIEYHTNKYFMLLCKEKNYYTIFNLNDLNIGGEHLTDILFDECVPNFGNLKCVNETEDKSAIEIWVEIDKEIYVMYFFPYDKGVIECCR